MPSIPGGERFFGFWVFAASGEDENSEMWVAVSVHLLLWLVAEPSTRSPRIIFNDTVVQS